MCETRDPSMETEIVSDIHYKWTNTNTLSWTLHNIATYSKNNKCLMLLVKSTTLGTVLNTQNMQETNLYLSNLYMCWLDESFACK
jgi:hypothetical protein